MTVILEFDGLENKRGVYSDEDCIKKFCKSLREHTMKVIIFEKKSMMHLTNEENESYLNQIKSHIC